MKKLIGIIFMVIIIYLSFFIVNQREYVILTQFGSPKKVIKNAGLYFKIPAPIQKVYRFDNRILTFKTRPIQLLLNDKNPLIISLYVCWKIEKPLLYFQSVINK